MQVVVNGVVILVVAGVGVVVVLAIFAVVLNLLTPFRSGH